MHVQKMMKRSLDCFRLLASIHHNFRICYRTRGCALVQGSSRKPRHRSKDCCCSCSSELFPASTAQHTTPLFHSCSFRFMSPAPLRFRISWYLSMYLITTMTHQMQCSTAGTPLNSSPQGSQALNPSKPLSYVGISHVQDTGKPVDTEQTGQMKEERSVGIEYTCVSYPTMSYQKMEIS